MDWLTISWLVSALAPTRDGGSLDASLDASEHEDDEYEHDEHDDPLLNEVIGATVIYPQEMAELQFNFNPRYRDRRDDHLGYVNWEIEIGATDWWQFDLAWNAPMIRGGAGVDTVGGFGDFELATQFTWMNMGGSPVSAALVFETSFPTARPEEELVTPVDPVVKPGPGLGFGEGRFTYQPFVTLSVDFPDARGQLFANLGAELRAEEQLPLVNVGVFVASSVVRPSLVFGWTLEEMRITPGMVILAGKFWEFAIGVPIGLNPQTARVGVDAMLIYEFNPLELVRH